MSRVAGGGAAGGGAPALSIRGLTFRYVGAAAPALRATTFEVHGGAALAVLGPNGAGKSTLLGAVVDALDGIRTGSVELRGDAGFPPSAIGFAPQDVALYLGLTVRENLSLMATLILGRRRAPAAVDGAVEDYQLQAILDVPGHRLSGGQRRIVHLAMSFLHHPPVRLLDEPTAGLDFETRLGLVRLVRRWREEGVAVVVTAHYPEDLEEMCTELLLLRDGRARHLGSLSRFLGGQGRRLRLVAVDEHGPVETVVELGTVGIGDLAGALARLGRRFPEATVDQLSLSSRSLRGLLQEDPELRRYVEDEHGDHPG